MAGEVRRWERALDWSPLPLALWLAGSVGWAFARRVRYPFDLEWMEGGMLVHAWRLSRGEPLYTAPTADWIPYVYPPGYASIVAAFGAVFGLDYPVARTLSAAGTLLAAAAVVGFGRRAGSTAVGLLGAATFLGTYRASGAFFDLVRPDGISIGLLAWVFWLASDRRRGTALAAGLLLASAFLVKHHSAAFGVPLALYLWSRDSARRALVFGLGAAVPAGLFTLGLELRSGHFLDYLLRVPASHPMEYRRLVPGTPGEIAFWLLPAVLVATIWIVRRAVGDLPATLRAVVLGALGFVGLSFGWWMTSLGDVEGVQDAPAAATGLVGCALAMAGAAVPLHVFTRLVDGRSWDRGVVGPWMIGGLALVVAGLMRGHNGGFSNVLMPLHLVVCVGFTLGASAMIGWGAAARTFVAVAFWGQLGWMTWALDLDPILPTPADVAAGETVLEAMKTDCAGEVLSPYAPWLPHRLGRTPGFHLIALWDVAHPDGPFRGSPRRIGEAAERHHWSCVLHGGQGVGVGFGIDPNYPVVHPIPIPARTLSPKTGWRVRTNRLLLPEP